MSTVQLGIWVSAIGTLAMMSLLVKENSYYRFFEHLFIGVSLQDMPGAWASTT